MEVSRPRRSAKVVPFCFLMAALHSNPVTGGDAEALFPQLAPIAPLGLMISRGVAADQRQ